MFAGPLPRELKPKAEARVPAQPGNMAAPCPRTPAIGQQVFPITAPTRLPRVPARGSHFCEATGSGAWLSKTSSRALET